MNLLFFHLVLQLRNFSLNHPLKNPFTNRLKCSVPFITATIGSFFKKKKKEMFVLQNFSFFSFFLFFVYYFRTDSLDLTFFFFSKAINIVLSVLTQSTLDVGSREELSKTLQWLVCLRCIGLSIHSGSERNLKTSIFKVKSTLNIAAYCLGNTRKIN